MAGSPVFVLMKPLMIVPPSPSKVVVPLAAIGPMPWIWPCRPKA
jgi:hypothetical protein